MPSASAAPAQARSAEVINEQIRALMMGKHPAARLTGDEQQEYQMLVEEWTHATLAERTWSLLGQVVRTA